MTKNKNKKETPNSILRWNWGAFVFCWIWGIFNNVWISLLTLIPIVGFVMAFVLGVKGNQWAWENSNITDVNLFLKKQRKWNIAAGVFALIVLLLAGAFLTIGIIESNKQNIKIYDNLNRNKEVVSLLGSPVKGGSPILIDSYSEFLQNGKYAGLSAYEFDAKGSKTTAHVVELWLKYEDKESLVLLEITPKNGEKHLLISPSDNPATAGVVKELIDKVDGNHN
jgi:hypothetical protein